MTTPTPSSTPEQAAQARANALVEYEANAKQPLISCLLLVGFIWVLVDAFLIQGELKSKNRALWAETATRYGAPLEPYPASAS